MSLTSQLGIMTIYIYIYIKKNNFQVNKKILKFEISRVSLCSQTQSQ